MLHRLLLPALALLCAFPASAQYEIQGNVLGSAVGFPSYAETLTILDQMRTQYPHLISARTSIGQTYEGRDLWMVELSDNPGADEGEPEALFTALIHGCEPLGLTTTLYTMWYLLEQYGSDPEVTYLLDNRRLFVLPIVNPDGYTYNTTFPNGGSWLRNSAPIDGFFVGTNLDHNFGYRWGHDNFGSCGDPSKNCFRGVAAFSELETQAVRAFVNARRIRTAFNYHSFHHSPYRAEPGRYVHSPWGYDIVPPPEPEVLDRMTEVFVEENGYREGALGGSMGYVNGSASDWMFGATDEHARIYAFDLVVGYEEDWPPAPRIIALARENVRSGLSLLWYAGAYVAPLAFEARDADSGNGYLDPGEAGQVTVRVRNDGGAPAQDVRFRLRSASPDLTVGDAWSDPLTVAPGDSATVGPFALTAAATRPLGISDDLTLEVAYAPSITQEQLLPDLTVGTPEVLYAWDGTSTDGWCSGPFDCPPDHWGLTSDAHSPPTAFTDTPGSLMRRGFWTPMTNQNPLMLSGSGPFYLSFWAKWQILAYNSLGAVFGRGDSPSTLLGFPTRRTRPADPDRPIQNSVAGKPIFDGAQFVWVREIANLTPYAALAFKLELVAYAQHSPYVMLGDGLYVDDIEVFRLVDASGIPTAHDGTPEAPLAFGISPVSPNPSAGPLVFTYTIDRPTRHRLVVFDVLGREVAVLASGTAEPGVHTVRWNGLSATGRAVAAGTYLVRLEAEGRAATRALTVLR